MLSVSNGEGFCNMMHTKKTRKRHARVIAKKAATMRAIDKAQKSRDNYFVPYQGGYATLGWIRNEIEARRNSIDEEFRERMLIGY